MSGWRLPSEEPLCQAPINSPKIFAESRRPLNEMRRTGTCLFASRTKKQHMEIKQACIAARLAQECMAWVGLDPAKFATLPLRRAKAVLIYIGPASFAPCSYCLDLRRPRALCANSAAGLEAKSRRNEVKTCGGSRPFARVSSAGEALLCSGCVRAMTAPSLTLLLLSNDGKRPRAIGM